MAGNKTQVDGAAQVGNIRLKQRRQQRFFLTLGLGALRSAQRQRLCPLRGEIYCKKYLFLCAQTNSGQEIDAQEKR